MKKIKLDKIVVWEYTCKRIPILTWLPKYGLVDSVSDLIAGFTVGLTLMPQAIAYAALAGLEPQVSIFCFDIKSPLDFIPKIFFKPFSMDCTLLSPEALSISYSAPLKK